MSTNNYGDYYGPSFRSSNLNNNKHYYQKKYNNNNNNNNIPKENKKHIPQANIREVEIKSISQTEPSKPKQISINNDDSNRSPKLDQGDGISKTNDDTPNILSLKPDLIYDDEPTFKDLNEQLKTILSKLDTVDIDIDKKVKDITQLVNDKCALIKKENQEELNKVKEALQKNITEAQNKNAKDIIEIKALLNWECLNQLRESLVILKGELYAKPEIINSVYQFEHFYDRIVSRDIKEKYMSNSTVSEIINGINETYNGKTLDQKFWLLVKNFKGKEIKKLKLNLSGSVYRIIKQYRGIPDDIIIEFGDIYSFLNEGNIKKAKKKIHVIVNLIFEILLRQIQSSNMSNKIFVYGHIYYGKHDKGLELKEFFENDIYYDFIHLK